MCVQIKFLKLNQMLNNFFNNNYYKKYYELAIKNKYIYCDSWFKGVTSFKLLFSLSYNATVHKGYALITMFQLKC